MTLATVETPYLTGAVSDGSTVDLDSLGRNEEIHHFLALIELG